jgi:ABC-type transporter Mla subunit MlaD
LVIDDTHALPLHPDASAEVRKKNLLGETYIDLQRGNASGEMTDGGNIPVNRTVPITEIDQVLAIFDPETVQRLQLLISSLGDATTNNGQNMNAEAASMNQLLSSLNGPALVLSARRQQVQDIVLELQRFYNVLAAQRVQVRDEFGTWNQVMAQMASQQGSISGTLQQADALLSSVDTLVSGEGRNLNAVLSNLPAALDSANAFLTQSNTITSDLAPYRQYINDIFPVLQTAFADTDPAGGHILEAYDVNCNHTTPNKFGICVGDVPSAYTPSASGDVWTALTFGGTGQ